MILSAILLLYTVVYIISTCKLLVIMDMLAEIKSYTMYIHLHNLFCTQDWEPQWLYLCLFIQVCKSWQWGDFLEVCGLTVEGEAFNK